MIQRHKKFEHGYAHHFARSRANWFFFKYHVTQLPPLSVTCSACFPPPPPAKRFPEVASLPASPSRFALPPLGALRMLRCLVKTIQKKAYFTMQRARRLTNTRFFSRFASIIPGSVCLFLREKRSACYGCMVKTIRRKDLFHNAARKKAYKYEILKSLRFIIPGSACLFLCEKRSACYGCMVKTIQKKTYFTMQRARRLTKTRFFSRFPQNGSINTPLPIILPQGRTKCSLFCLPSRTTLPSSLPLTHIHIFFIILALGNSEC